MIGQDKENLNLKLSTYNMQVSLDSSDLSIITIIQDGETFYGIIMDLQDQH